MGLERSDFFMRVIVEDTQLKVVRACDEPVLSGDEFDATNRHFRHLKSLDDRASIVVVYVDRAVVQSSQQPWFRRVKVDALDTI